jgi:malate dehydrogenase (oxaloacetate-decarboxylating)
MLTIRARISATVGSFGRVMAAIGETGADVGGVDIVTSSKESVTRDITVATRDAAHGDQVVTALRAVDGVTVLTSHNRTLLSHIGGKMTMQNRAALTSRDDLSMAYTPGVARVCMAIHHDPERTWDLTIRGNSVAVVTDGSSVVGQGDLGPLAALPSAEAKCMFLRELAGIDGFPLPLDVRDPDQITHVVSKIVSVFAGVHLTDMAAPACFDVQNALRELLDIPVLHDNQEGTSAALLAGVINGFTLTGKTLENARVVIAGVGPSGVATAKLLVTAGVGEVVTCNSDGSLHAGKQLNRPELQWIAENTNPDRREGDARTLVAGADAFIGLSEPGVLDVAAVKSMAKDPLVFALAMPAPEVDPDGAAAVYATGRPDLPNQINSSLAFPGIWRGLLDCRATRLDDGMVLAAARAIAATSAPALAPDNVVPSVFNADLVPNVAAAVRAAAEAGGHARLVANP